VKFTRQQSLVAAFFIAGLTILPGVSQADMADVVGSTQQSIVTLRTGYLGHSLKDEPGRAGEFKSLQSGPTFDLRLFGDTGPFYLDLEGAYRNEDDYALSAGLNGKGQVSLSVRSDRFVHNFSHIPYDNTVEGSRPDSNFGSDRGSQTLFYSDADPGESYGLRLDFKEAKAKVKLPNYPAHLNLSYWRYEKKGETQLRFADHGSANNCSSCHLQSRTRTVDRVTEEVKVGIDAHAEYIDFALEGLYRQFRAKEKVPVDSFRGRGQLDPGDYPHDQIPDSTLKEVAIKLSSAPSGSLVAGLSLTAGERENRSDSVFEKPIQAKTDYLKSTADLTYTPSAKWMYSFRYRRLNLDNDNSDVLTSYAGSASTLPVREAIDIERAWYEGVVNYNPWRSLTLKAELRTEDIERDFADSQAWNLPKNEMVTKAKVGFQSRMLERSALKVNGWLAFQHSDDPAYISSAENRTELFLSSTFLPKKRWGLSATLTAVDERRDDSTVEQLSRAGELFDYDLARSQQQRKGTFGGWFSPAAGLVLNLSYGYFWTAIEQDLLFGTSPSSDPASDRTLEDEDVDFRQTVHTVTAGATWQATEEIECRLEGYHIRSQAYYSPDFQQADVNYSNGVGIMSSADLKEISEIDTTQNGLRGRVSWRLNDLWSCSVDASLDDYDASGSDLYDGVVQTAMVSFARSW